MQSEIDDDEWYPCEVPCIPVCCDDCPFGELGGDPSGKL